MGVFDFFTVNDDYNDSIMQKSVWMLAAAFFFSVMAAFTKLGAQHFDTLELIFYRSLFGVIMVAMWVRSKHQTLKTPLAFSHIKRSFFGTLGMSIWFYAIAHLPLGTAMTLNYTSPLYMAGTIAVLSWWHKHPLNFKQILAVIMGFIGVVFVLRPELRECDELPALIGLTSGFFRALAYFQVKELSAMKEPEWRIVFYFTLFGTIWGALGQLLMKGHFNALTMDSIPALIGIGITATLAQLSMTRAWGAENILLTAVFQYTAIVFATIIGVFFFSESLPWQSATGIAIILVAGVWATLVNRHHKLPKAKTPRN